MRLGAGKCNRARMAVATTMMRKTVYLDSSLANANKRQHIAVINTRLKLFIPEIVTPMELFTETDA
jgi:hypothetical protein